MASPNSWPAGLAGTGFELAELTNDYFSGEVRWLDTVRGNDANTGLEREMPKRTLAGVMSATLSNDMVVIEAGSAETLTAPQTFPFGVTIIGLGQGSNRPRFTNASGAAMFSVNQVGVKIYNLYFPAPSAISNDTRIATTANETEINTCYFEHGAFDSGGSGIALNAGANSCRLINNLHVVTASRPYAAVIVNSGVSDLYVENLVLDGGSYGWLSYAFNVLQPSARIFVNGVTLMNRSDFAITATSCTYKIFGVDTSGSSRVVIAA